MVAFDMSDVDVDKWDTFDLYLQMSSKMRHPEPPPQELAFVKAKIPGTQQVIDFTILRHPIVDYENVTGNEKKMAELQETWTVLLIQNAFKVMKKHELAKARVAKGRASEDDRDKSKTTKKEYKEAFWNLAAIVARVCTIQAMRREEPEVLRELTQSLSKLSEKLSDKIVAAAWDTFNEEDDNIPHPNDDVGNNYLAQYRQGVNNMRERRRKHTNARSPEQLHAMAQRLGKNLGIAAEPLEVRRPRLRRELR